MKKIILSICSIVAIGGIVFMSCTKKNDDAAITPGYSKDGLGTGANPNTTIVTTTGTIATTSTANQNSSFLGIGQNASWSSVGCVTGQTCLVVTNSSIGANVSVCFNGPVAAGTYALVSNPSSIPVGSACLKIENPSSQPTGTIWYSASGSVVVTEPTIGKFTATFSSIACFQSGSTFPQVTASGQAACF